MSDCSMLALILTVGTVRVLRSNCHSRHFFTPESSSRLSYGHKKKTPFGVSCVPREARTLDPLIKSQLLYQLS